MQLTSINSGTPRQLGDQTTGIYKTSISGRVEISELGIPNDAICDTKYHGGVDQAIYVYGGEDYQFWQAEAHLELDPGTFGENLTISGLSSLRVHVGDRLHIGEVELEATAPRIPCGTLGNRMMDAKFPIAFRRSQRCGFYCRVLQTGMIEAGTTVTLKQPNDELKISIVELFELNYNPQPTQTLLNRALAAPIAIRERNRLQELSQKLYG